MPELLEVEYYRRLAVGAVGRVVVGVDAPDPWYLKDGLSRDVLCGLLLGAPVAAVDRHGKRLLLHFGEPAGDGALRGSNVLGLHFGMTGRLLLDGRAAIARLEYGSSRNEAGWQRFGLRFEGGGSLVVIDPRRLGGVLLDPDPGQLGPDAAAIGAAPLAAILRRSGRPLKAVLLDQARVAGLGNLLVDEILWRARLSPLRPAAGLDDSACRALHRTLRSTLRQLDGRGGSHTGDLFQSRGRGGCCPRCGTVLDREQVGGRTTFWCPTEQS